MDQEPDGRRLLRCSDSGILCFQTQCAMQLRLHLSALQQQQSAGRS